MENVQNQSRFDRSLYNDKKQGAYFTDLENARLIASFFEFPDEEVCCLEPSIGDGSAVAAITGKDKGNNVTIFGAEINRERYNVAKNNPHIDYVVMADFLQGFKMTNGKCSFCMANPPYGKSMLGERYEKAFLRRIDNYMMPGGILCFIIPYYVFLDDDTFAQIFTNRFDILSILKFRQPEFNKFKQVAVIAVKKQKNSPNNEMANQIVQYISNIDTVYEIPLNVPNRIKVPPSSSSSIAVFEGTGVDLEDIKNLPNSSKLFNLFAEKTFFADSFSKLGQPPILPGKDHLYLLSVCGYSEGRMGSEENKDVHLCRGNVIEGETRTVENHPDGRVIVKVKTYKKTVVNIIENDGSITELA
ncbi:MAG: DUF6094 domain-containing protein [Clostridia bacterium]